jgi:hypothetical protein
MQPEAVSGGDLPRPPSWPHRSRAGRSARWIASRRSRSQPRAGLSANRAEPEKWSPKTRTRPITACPTSRRGHVRWRHHQRELRAAEIRDPRILEFMRKITVREDPVLTARGGAAVPRASPRPSSTDSASLARSTTRRASPGRPMSRTRGRAKIPRATSPGAGSRGASMPSSKRYGTSSATPELAGLLAMLRVQRS